MKLRRRPLLHPALLLVLSAAARAQTATQVPPEVRRGMMSTAPVGLLVSSSPDALLIADPGQSGAPPAPWSPARFGAPGFAYPEYTLESIFGPSLAPYVVLTGISTGNDWMPQFHPDGKMDMQADPLWFALTVSVTNLSSGAPGSHVERVSAGGADSPGAELFTYYAEGSVGIAHSLPNTTLSERSRESLGLAAPEAEPVDRPDISGIDYGLGVIPFDPNQQAGLMFGFRDRVYFTLAAECVGALGPGFALQPGGGLPAVPADSATIYVSYWVPDGTGVFAWSQPQVYCSAAQLGLFPEADQIDAIAVHAAVGRVIFSTLPVPGRNQLLVYLIGQGGPPQVVKAPNGVDVTVHLGLTESSDVDGTCGIDPELVYSYSGAVGIPELSYVVAGEEPLGISLARAQPGHAGADQIHVHVTGASGAGSPGILALCAADRQSALAGSPLKSSGWLLVDAQPYAPGQLEASWTFPGPSVGAVLDLAVVAYLLKSDFATPMRSSWVSILKLAP